MKVCCRCGSLCSEQGHSSSSSINTWDYLGLTLILRSFDTYHSGSTVLGSSRFNFEHACCEVFGIAQIPVISILGTSPRLRASSFCRLIFFSSWLARPTWCRAMSPKGTLLSQQNVFIFVCKGPKGTQCLINCLIFCDSDIIIILLLLFWLLLLYYIYILFIYGSRFEFPLWGRGLILYWSIKIPNLSHYKTMVLNHQRITENDNMILLQNEDWFLSWGYLKGKFHHYKMTIGFYHQVTWRGHSATTKWRLVFLCFYHQVTWRESFNTTKWHITCCTSRASSFCPDPSAQLPQAVIPIQVA